MWFDICNGPNIAIKMAKNKALRLDEVADMDKRNHQWASKISL